MEKYYGTRIIKGKTMNDFNNLTDSNQIATEFALFSDFSNAILDAFKSKVDEHKEKLNGKMTNVFLLGLTGTFLTCLLKDFNYDQTEDFLNDLKGTFMLWKKTQQDEKK